MKFRKVKEQKCNFSGPDRKSSSEQVERNNRTSYCIFEPFAGKQINFCLFSVSGSIGVIIKGKLKWIVATIHPIIAQSNKLTFNYQLRLNSILCIFYF